MILVFQQNIDWKRAMDNNIKLNTVKGNTSERDKEIPEGSGPKGGGR